jgi:hypothetical protein
MVFTNMFQWFASESLDSSSDSGEVYGVDDEVDEVDWEVDAPPFSGVDIVPIVYRDWIESCDEVACVSYVQQYNFMVFEMMKDYCRYVHMAPIFLYILRRGVELLNIPSNRDPARLSNVQLWIHRTESRLAKYREEEEYVLHFLGEYNRNNEIAQDPRAKELFNRFDGGRWFFNERMAFHETDFYRFLPQYGGCDIIQHVLECEDVVG